MRATPRTKLKGKKRKLKCRFYEKLGPLKKDLQKRQESKGDLEKEENSFESS